MSKNNPVKIITRTLSKYKGQTFILFFLTLLPGLFYTFLDIPITAVNNASSQVCTGSEPEQFRFMVSVPSSNITQSNAENESMASESPSNINQPNIENESSASKSPSNIDQLNAANDRLKSKYGFTSELVRKKFLQQNSYDKKCNFYIKLMPESINTPIFLTGKAPSRNGEVAVSKLFAEKHKLSPGSPPIEIDGKDYDVSGIYIAPDEVVAYDQAKSPDMSSDTNARILMLENDFKAVNRDENIYFVGRFATEDDDYIRNQISSLTKEDTILYATMSSEYTEVSELATAISRNTQLMFFMLFAVCLILLVSILIQITNQFASYRKSIGTLMSMGFSRPNVVFSYSIYFFVFAAAALSGMILGFFMSYSQVEIISNSYNVAFAEPSVDWLKWLIFLGAATLPLTLFVMVLAYKETKKMPLALMSGSNNKQRVSVFVKGVKNVTSSMKLKNRVKISVVVHKAGRLISILLAFFIAYNLLGASLAITYSMERTLSDYEDFLKFDHIEYYDSVRTENKGSQYDSNADVFIDENVKLIQNTTKGEDIGIPLKMQGLWQDQKSIGIDNTLLANGVIISQIAASKYGIATNDDLQFLIDDVYYRYIVVGINEAASDNKIYIDIRKMYEWNKYTEGDYTGAYITGKSKEQDVYDSIRNEDLIKFYKDYNEHVGATVSGALLLVSFVIALSLIILMAIFNYNDTIVHVALAKFLGYRNRLVNNMFVNVFDPVGVIGCLLGALSLPFLLNWLEKVLIVQSAFSSDYYTFFKATPKDMAITFVALMFCYGFCKFSINLVTRRRSIASVLKSE
ncbi:MAG: ABC transporter permease [Peptococcaceae bacterium]|nr:ABC transporter permease [Peptococcaceae bacterium]